MKQRIRDGRQLPFFPVIKADLEALAEVCLASSLSVRLSSVRSVYFALLELANDQRMDETTATRGRVAEIAGVSSRTVWDAAQVMQSAGMLTVTEQAGMPSTWTLTSPEPRQPLPAVDEVTPAATARGSGNGCAGLARGGETSASNSHNASPQEEKNSRADDVEEVFAHWKTVMGHPRAALDHPRRRRIESALRLFDSIDDRDGRDECMRAIDGCHASDYHMRRGEYSSRDGAIHDGIQLIFRDAEKLEGFIALAPSPSQAGVAGMSSSARVRLAQDVSKAKQRVRRGWENRDIEHWRQEGDLAAAWLRGHHIYVIHPEGPDGPPSFEERLPE